MRGKRSQKAARSGSPSLRRSLVRQALATGCARSKGVLSRGQKLDTFDMVLFGGTGDLALRKLVPALYRRHVAGQMGPLSRVLAVARTNLSRDEYLAQIEATCRKHLG